MVGCVVVAKPEQHWQTFAEPYSAGLWCKFQRRGKNGVFSATSPSGKDCRPNSGRSGIFEAQVREIELSFANAMRQLDARDRDRRVPETFEAEHRVDPGLDVAMILVG